MNGKGDRDRTSNREAFRQNHDAINWSKWRFKKVPDKEAPRYEVRDGKWCRVNFRGKNPHKQKGIKNDT